MTHDREYICTCSLWNGIELNPTQEIVRCKDCKWYEKDFGNDWGVCFHRDWTGGSIGHCVDADGYCYRGERE